MNNQSMHPNQSSYNLWTWLIAILLALFLLWKLMSGNGPTSVCCGVGSAVTDIAPAALDTPDIPTAAVDEAFNFVASGAEFTSNGNNADVGWLANKDALVSLLSSGEDLRAQGDNKNVILSGIVESEAIKLQTGVDAQAFFGSEVTIDNQIVIKAAPSMDASTMAPQAAKLYFDTGKTGLPANTDARLMPIIEWLKAHDSAKAVLSGFHDPRGNKSVNEELAKNRAKSVYAALITAGIDEGRIEMRKPVSVEGDGDLAEARRVEVSVE